MRLKFQRDMKIVNALLFFCHHAGAKEYEVKIKPGHDVTRFEITVNIPHLSEAHLETLQSALKLQRSREVEQNYWEIESDMNAPDELTLIGMMLDESTVEYENGILKINSARVE